MLKCHELIGFMPQELAEEILEFLYRSDKPTYKAALAAVAEAQRVRPVFLERKPRKERHVQMIQVLSRPRMEDAAASVLREWLLKAQKPMIIDFLNALEIEHEDGLVEDFPDEVDPDKLRKAIEMLLEKYPPLHVAIYLNTVRATSDVNWGLLQDMLENDERLQIA